MDAVILAGGRGERMTDITSLYRKPLLEVDGVPLVRRAVELAISVGVAEPVVVAAPPNALDICEALAGLPVALIIQARPLGPADALRVGLKVHNVSLGSYRVMVLLADNVLRHEDLETISRHETAVGVAVKPRSEAGRFTWFDPDSDDWREKVEIPDGEPVECWVGPFVGLRSKMDRVTREVCLAAREKCSEALIGPYLGRMTNEEHTPRIRVSSIDVGTPEAYAAVKGWK